MAAPRSENDAHSVSPTTLKQLGRYELLDVIAAGGMATVFRAQTSGPGGFRRTFAIKVCHPHLALQEKYRKMFLDEARLAGRVDHPNVVAILDVDDGDPPHMVMEYVEGASLAELLKEATSRGEHLPIPTVLRIIRDALGGLEAAHELRDDDGKPLHFIHRDVSPQNVLVGRNGVSKLTDFGVARAEDRLAETESGQVKGKWAYMAPEQFLQRPLTRRTDLFAMAVVLWEALTSKRLFKSKDITNTASEVLSGVIEAPSRHREEVTDELDRLVLRGLSRASEGRFSSARAFASALEELPTPPASTEEVGEVVEALVGEELRARRQASTPAVEGAAGQGGAPRQASALRWKIAFGLALGAALTVFGVLLLWWGADPPRGPSQGEPALHSPSPGDDSEGAEAPDPASKATSSPLSGAGEDDAVGGDVDAGSTEVVEPRDGRARPKRPRRRGPRRATGSKEAPEPYEPTAL